MSSGDTGSLARFFSRSRAFHDDHKRPVGASTTLERLVEDKHISASEAVNYIKSTRIIVHDTVRCIAKDFLAYKRIHGTKTEKQVYAQLGWEVNSFLVRLIKQRPLVFYNRTDTTLLRNKKTLQNGISEWDRVGSDHEHEDVSMKDYLCYDEIMLSSLIGVSCQTPYFNDGNRLNRGKWGKWGTYQRDGIQIGLVGPRFERAGRMDCTYAFSKGDSRPPPRFFPFVNYFPGNDFEARYRARIRITIETLLLEAELRGKERSTGVYLHVVGLGLGVWCVSTDQRIWYVDEFAKCLGRIAPRWIRVLEFAYIDVDSQQQSDVESAASKCGATCLFNRRPPSAKLPDPDLLLVTTYAWDGNAYPGNEYYFGMLTASGDPAAACSSAIAELQNPEINTDMLKEVHVLKSGR